MPEFHETRSGMRVLEVIMPAIATHLKTIAENTACLSDSYEQREKVKIQLELVPIELELIPDMVRLLRQIVDTATPPLDILVDERHPCVGVDKIYVQAAREILARIDNG